MGDVYGRQSPQDVGEVFLGVDPAPSATDDQRVDHGTAPARVGMANEEPAATTHGRNPDGVFDEIMPPPGLCRVAKLEAHIAAERVSTRGIIRGSPRRRAAGRLVGNAWGPPCFSSLWPVPSPSSPCRHGGRGGWSGLTRGPTNTACSGLVFLINLLGDFIQFTVLSILIVPACFTLGLGGWMQGIGLAGVHASSGLSLGLFLLMGGLEWITYVLATVAGVNT